LFNHPERESAEMVRRNGAPRRGDEMGAQNGRLKNKWTRKASSTDYALWADALKLFTEANKDKEELMRRFFTGGNGGLTWWGRIVFYP